MKLTDSEWASARKLRRYLGEQLDKMSNDPDRWDLHEIRDTIETIEALERALESEHRES